MDNSTLMGENSTSTAALPSWLEPSHATTHASSVPTSTPTPSHPINPPTPPLSKEAKELTVFQFEIMFDRVLDEIASGRNLLDVFKSDARNLDTARFMRWVKKDPERKLRYEQAQTVAAEIRSYECIEIADAMDSMEDVQRSRLRIETRMAQIKAYDRQRYGDTKTVEFAGGISVKAALSDAMNEGMQRVISNVIEDVTDVEAMPSPSSSSSPSSSLSRQLPDYSDDD